MAAGGGAGSSRAGFVLAGGRSSRMGRDKALLAAGAETMIQYVARQVLGAAGMVIAIAPLGRYESLGLPVIADEIPGCGPLGGLYTALKLDCAEWNLIVACDTPGVTQALFEDLFHAAVQQPPVDAVVAQGDGQIHPLCAVYHRRCAAAARAAIDRHHFKMHDFVSTLRTVFLPVSDATLLRNLNTPEDWDAR